MTSEEWTHAASLIAALVLLATGQVEVDVTASVQLSWRITFLDVPTMTVSKLLASSSKTAVVLTALIPNTSWYSISNRQTNDDGDVEARFGRLNDPLLQSERTRVDEERIAMQCVTGERLSSADIERLRLPAVPLVPLGRQGTSWKQWVSMNVNDIESSEHQKSRW